MTFQIALRRSAVMVSDFAMWLVAMFILVLVRYDLELSSTRIDRIAIYAVAAASVQLGLGLALQHYLGRSRLGTFPEVTMLGALVLVASLLTGGGALMLDPSFSRAVAVFVPMLTLANQVGVRLAVRSYRTASRARSRVEATPALVYGAGDAGVQLARLLDSSAEPPYSLVGFLDDDPGKKYLRILGYRVLGRGDQLEQIAERHDAEAVILAISQATPELMRSLDERCRAAGLKLVVVPPVREMIDGRVELDQLRSFNVADLLGRRPVETDLSAMAGYLNSKVVLVTGAGGSIGSELARQLSRLGPAKLLMLDRDESGLHAVQLSIDGRGLLDGDELILCDIRDLDAVRKVFRAHRPQVVFHAAALKHLPMLERFPDEGWKTNVLGTLNVLTAAEEVGVERFVNISTDKAADATCVLGQTKRLAERLTAHHAARTGRPYLSVRFGNVLGSRGSVLFAFREQIQRGGPLTVTHPDVTRYFMTIPEACELVLQAGAIGHPGDVLVLDMGEPVKIVDVAKRLIEESGRRDVPIVYTGLRPGEKLHEVLFSASENRRRSGHPLISEVSVPAITPGEIIAADTLGGLHRLHEDEVTR